MNQSNNGARKNPITSKLNLAQLSPKKVPKLVS
jgi:hypothetical protein